MPKQQWQYADNQFLNATDNSYRLALHIGRQHDDALNQNSSDPFIAGLYASFHPLYTAMDGAFDAWVAAGGLREGTTLNLRQQLRILSGTKAKAWDVSIQNVYANDTPRYRALLPDHRIPFQRGPQLRRIGAVNSLSTTIGADAALAAVKLDVDATYTQLAQALSDSLGNSSSLSILSDAVEVARVNMCVGMFADTGLLMHQYAANPELMLPYYDLAALRKGQQVIFTSGVKIQSVHNIVDRTFGPSDPIEFVNDGNTELHLYLTDTRKGLATGTVLTFAAHARRTFEASELGTLTNRYLNVFNPDTFQKGHFTIDFNPPSI